jgi:hypothetical protein
MIALLLLASVTKALRVPKVVAQEIGASDGKTAEMSVRDGKLVWGHPDSTQDGTAARYYSLPSP